MILMVTEKAVTVREYRFRLVQKCKNAVKCRLSGDEILKISTPLDAFGVSAWRLRRLVPPLKNPGYAPAETCYTQSKMKRTTFFIFSHIRMPYSLCAHLQVIFVLFLSAAEDDEISLRMGDVITDVYEDNGWLYGTAPDGSSGLFPSCFVRYRAT